jgi:hypothetical protein
MKFFTRENPPVDKEYLDKFQHRLGIPLSEDYKGHLLAYNGAGTAGEEVFSTILKMMESAFIIFIP